MGKLIDHRAITGQTIHDLKIDTPIGTRYHNIWSLAVTSLFEFQGLAREWIPHSGDSGGYYKEHPSFIIAKERTRVVLDIRSRILDLVEGIEDELLEQNFGYIWSGIRSRLRNLDEFEGIYNRDV